MIAGQPPETYILSEENQFTITDNDNFNNGTFNNTYASSDNLYANIYEDWGDSEISDELNRIATGNSWVDYEGYARQYSAIAYGVGFHYSGNVSLVEINNFNSSNRFNAYGYMYNEWRNNNIFGLTHKNSTPTSTDYGEKILYEYF